MQKLLADERNLKEKLEEEIFSLKKSGDNSPAKPKDSELHQQQVFTFRQGSLSFLV